jgi:endoglucanase
MRAPISVCLAALAAALPLAGCAGSGSATGSTSHPAIASRTDPLLAAPFYVDPKSPAAEQLALERNEGETRAATAMSRIASQPTGNWFTEGGGVEAAVRALTVRAAAAGRQPLLVAYYIPGRDCGGYSSGGAPSPAAYRTWVERFAAGIGGRRATVILEPDAIPQALTGCLDAAQTKERLALLRHAVEVLRSHRRVTVYLDAGNPGWIRPAENLAAPLRRAGIAHADGFALNVSNFFATGPTIAYGRRLSSAIGGAGGGVHFIVDTGRNGKGPYGAGSKGLDWCNPPGRALGAPPGTDTASPLVDAYLWVKQPGMSDGSCRPGEPRAGRWWPQYALALAGDPHPGL